MDIGDVSFSVNAIVGKTTLSKEEFNSLCCGDIILLDQQLKHPLKVDVGENGHVFGYPGINNCQKAIKIEGF